MAIASDYVLHGILTPSAAFISNISNQRLSPAIQHVLGYGAGYYQPLFVGNIGQKPMIGFDTLDVKTVLDLTGVGMADLSAGNTDLFFKKAKAYSIRTADATAEHVRNRLAAAALYLGSLRAGSQSEASLSCDLIANYDGTNEPIVPTGGSVALSGTPTSGQHFVAGPITINTTSYTGVQSVNIDFGIQKIQLSGDGEIYDTFQGIRTQAPTITATFIGLPLLNTFGLNGTALTGLSVYLRKVSTTGRVANGTAQHIKFAATSGVITVEDESGGGNGDVITTLKFTLTAANTSTNALTVDTASTIT